MHCYVSAVKQPDSAGRDLGVNVPTCHANGKQVSKHLIPQTKEFQEFTTLLKCVPAELFAADSQSWHA
jgi:hypothetical protein